MYVYDFIPSQCINRAELHKPFRRRQNRHCSSTGKSAVLFSIIYQILGTGSQNCDEMLKECILLQLIEHNKIGRNLFNKNQRSIYKSKEIVAIFLCRSCYGFAIVMMDNVWQYVTQLFEHIMSPKSLSMAYCTYGLNQFFLSTEPFFF